MRYFLDNADDKQIAATVDLQALSCIKCKKLANNPLQCNHCDILICCPCFIEDQPCLRCNEKSIPRINKFVTLIFQTTLIKCIFGCDAKILLKNAREHEKTCPMNIIQCKCCKKNIQNQEITKHLYDSHIETCQRMILQIHHNKEKVHSGFLKIGTVITKDQKKVDPFAYFMQIEEHSIVETEIKINKFGKKNCGGVIKANQKKFFGSSFFRGSKENEVCGLTGNCNSCMESDIKRYQLPKGYLLNLEGRICKYDPTQKIMFCKRLSEKSNFYCSEIKRCQACSNTQLLINKDQLYRDFI